MLSIHKNNTNHIILDRNLTDFLKFIACIMVALSHYCGYALVNGVSSSFIYRVIAATGGYLGVAVFFFLSGYGLMMSDIKRHLEPFDFLKRRLSKTYLPAVLVSVIWLLIALIVNTDLLCNKKYFLGVVWYFNDEVMWFVRTIVVMYVFFYVYRIISVKIIRDIYKLLLLIFFTIIAYFTIRVTGIGMSLSVPLFFLGIAVAQFPQYIKKLFNDKWIVSAMFVSAIILLWLFRHDNYLLHGWGNYVTIGLIIFLITHYEIKMRPLPKWVGGGHLLRYIFSSL